MVTFQQTCSFQLHLFKVRRDEVTSNFHDEYNGKVHTWAGRWQVRTRSFGWMQEHGVVWNLLCTSMLAEVEYVLM